MALKSLLIFLFIIIFVFFIFLLVSNSSNYNPNGFSLNISENLLPDVGVYVLDSNEKIVITIDQNEVYFIQQRGLP
ncbi:MAG: hypothetical protein WC307_02905 [Candidatus Nanoarchaeia archaeon]|jgi:YbbR domain-containing protein